MGTDPETARKMMTELAQLLFSQVQRQLLRERREVVFGKPTKPVLILGFDHVRKLKFLKQLKKRNHDKEIIQCGTCHEKQGDD